MWRMPFALCLLTTGLAAARTSPAQPADDEAVRTVARSYIHARELQDPAAIEAIGTDDADQHTNMVPTTGPAASPR